MGIGINGLDRQHEDGSILWNDRGKRGIKMREEIKEVTIAQTGTASTGFDYEYWALFVGLELPAMDNGAIYLDMEDSIDGSYHPILDPATGDDAVVCLSGSEPGFVDVTDWLRFATTLRQIRVRSATAQNTAAVTIYVHMRG